MRAVPLVRVPWQELWMAKRVMDIGALGVIFPFCSTIERVEQAAAACRYPPMGKRGCGPTLAQVQHCYCSMVVSGGWAVGVGS